MISDAELSSITQRDLGWSRLVWTGGDKALEDEFNHAGNDRRALLAEVDCLRRELYLLRNERDNLAHNVDRLTPAAESWESYLAAAERNAECVCPTCGLRHGGLQDSGDF
jgi:hypothetical protein